MEKVNFTSNDFLFMAKPEQYYIEGHPVQCDGDYTDWKPDKIVEDGWGMFNGLTMVSYEGLYNMITRDSQLNKIL